MSEILKDRFSSDDKYSLKRLLEKDGRVIKRGPSGTKIIIKNLKTGKVEGEFHNKILIPASQFTACTQFGVDAVVPFPNYNDAFGLDHTLTEGVQPKNRPLVCLFGVGNDGCGPNVSDVYTVRYTERISPTSLLPFRYVDSSTDLDGDQRKVYFGRYTDSEGMIRYMFKAFDSEPQLHIRYLDGTEVTSDVFNIDTDQGAETYVECRLRVDRIDFRDYFDKKLGWGKAYINCIGLMYGWYDDTVDDFKWYQQILPFSRLNIPNEWLVDLDKALEFTYQVYY